MSAPAFSAISLFQADNGRTSHTLAVMSFFYIYRCSNQPQAGAFYFSLCALSSEIFHKIIKPCFHLNENILFLCRNLHYIVFMNFYKFNL